MPTAILDDMPDFDLIERELVFLTAHPDLHRQDIWTTKEIVLKEGVSPEPNHHLELNCFTWTCGTSGCLAGWAALHLGYKVDWKRALEDEWRTYDPAYDGDDFLAYLAAKGGANGAYLEGGRPLMEVVREKFGLNHYQFGRITDGENTVDKMWDLLIEFREEWASWTAKFDSWSDYVRNKQLRIHSVEGETKGQQIRKLAEYSAFVDVFNQ